MIPDRCETLDGTVSTTHALENVAAIGRPVWVCMNCGCAK